MNVEDAAYRPASGDPVYPSLVAVEEDWLPHAIKLKGFGNVVIGAAVVHADIKRDKSAPSKERNYRPDS